MRVSIRISKPKSIYRIIGLIAVLLALICCDGVRHSSMEEAALITRYVAHVQENFLEGKLSIEQLPSVPKLRTTSLEVQQTSSYSTPGKRIAGIYVSKNEEGFISEILCIAANGKYGYQVQGDTRVYSDDAATLSSWKGSREPEYYLLVKSD